MKTYVHKEVIFGVLLLIIAIGSDQLVKYIFNFSSTRGYPLISSLISPPFTLIIALATITGLIIALGLTERKVDNTLKNYLVITKIGVIAVLAGGISNLIDLVTKGYIVDVFNLTGIHFNISDAYIVTGSAIIIFTIAFRT